MIYPVDKSLLIKTVLVKACSSKVYWSSCSALGICFKRPSLLCCYWLNLVVEVDKEEQQIIVLFAVMSSDGGQFVIFTSTVIDGFNCRQIRCRLIDLMTPELSFTWLQFNPLQLYQNTQKSPLWYLQITATNLTNNNNFLHKESSFIFTHTGK